MATVAIVNGYEVIVKIKRVMGLIWLVLALSLVACTGYNTVETTFDEREGWGVGTTAEAEGAVADGVYRLKNLADRGIFWSTSGTTTGDGTYVIEATQTAGPLDNGYGLMFMVDAEALDFYLFEISGDGYVWIGRCTAGCEGDQAMLVDEGWFESEVIKQGLNETNRLRVEVKDGAMVFYVNGTEVGRGADRVLTEGEVGVLVETLGEGGVEVEFDNFKYTPDPDDASFFGG
jgi:hypothetical protein